MIKILNSLQALTTGTRSVHGIFKRAGNGCAVALAVVLVLAGGCRVLSPPVEIGTAERPPRLILPADACPSVRQAAEELASLLELAYDLSLQPEEVDDLAGIADQNRRFCFFVGFAPPKNVPSLREDEFGYATTGDGVYLFGRPTEAWLSNDDISWAPPAIDLAVYRFLENEMGFRWLTLEPRGYYFPPTPSRLRRGALVTIRARLVDWPESMTEDAAPDNSGFSDWPGNQTKRELAARRQWLRRFGVVVRRAPEHSVISGLKNRRELFFPGHEHRLLAEEKGKDRILSAAIMSGGSLDWGLADFARYAAAKTLAGESADWKEMLDDFVLGMSSEPAASVRRYFEFWRDIAEEYRQKPEGALPVPIFDLYTEDRLDQSEKWLLQAQGAPGLGTSARFRLESLRLGHQHLKLSRASWAALQRATEPPDLEEARQAARQLVQARRQIGALTNIDPVRLAANEAARGDLAGTEFHRESSGLTGVDRIDSWRVREHLRPAEQPTQWRQPDDIDWSAWRELQDVSFGIPAEPTADRWFAATPAWQEGAVSPDQLYLLVWGWIPESEVYLNGVRLSQEMPDERVTMASARLRIPADTLAEDHRQLLIIRPGESSVAVPARAVWLMSERTHESAN